MLPTRFGGGQPSAAALRKSRLEGKPSLLPKPRQRPGSTDRLSSEARRPSNTGHRSSSAEPPRSTFGGRLSREASATKVPLNGRSRSHQMERFGQSSMTPLRTNYLRITATPSKSPSAEHASRNWQVSLERALAFVTVKDQRVISNVVWQRSEFARVQDELNARGNSMGSGVLIRPLTIARFVEITSALLSIIFTEPNMNTDNYIIKLPHLCKRLLYPGTISKSWLKAVNTLHAFPHALALIGYLVDIVNHLETPVNEDILYLDKSKQACLQREYLSKCFMRFQVSPEFDDLDQEYLHDLKLVLNIDEEKIAQLQATIDKYSRVLEDEEEAAEKEHELRCVERRDVAAETLRHARAERRQRAVDRAQHDALAATLATHLRQLDLDIERATVEIQELKKGIESQSMSIEERTRLRDQVDYATKVQDSKQILAEQIAKMVAEKEREVALWQNRCLDACVTYNSRLVHLSAVLPDLAAFAVDENSLMESDCCVRVSGAVDALRMRANMLAERRGQHARERAALAKARGALLEETAAKIKEIKMSIQREQEALDAAVGKESVEATAWAHELAGLRGRLEELRGQQEEHLKVDHELDFWQKQNDAWLEKLSALHKYIEMQREKSQHVLQEAYRKRERLVLDYVSTWRQALTEATDANSSQVNK